MRVFGVFAMVFAAVASLGSVAMADEGSNVEAPETFEFQAEVNRLMDIITAPTPQQHSH